MLTHAFGRSGLICGDRTLSDPHTRASPAESPHRALQQHPSGHESSDDAGSRYTGLQCTETHFPDPAGVAGDQYPQVSRIFECAVERAPARTAHSVEHRQR